MIEINNLEETLKKDGMIVSHIKGKSMLPFLNENKDRVIISNNISNIKLYDVVLFKYKNKYVLHRIIDIKDDTYIIRGDNCVGKEIIKKENILGVLVAFYNQNKYVEINDELNSKAYNKSKNGLFFRKIRNIFIKIK